MSGGRWRGGAVVLAAVAAIGLLETVAYSIYLHVQGGQATALLPALAQVLPWWVLWGALTPIVVWLARRFDVTRNGWRDLLLVHLPAGLALAALHIVLWGWMRYVIIAPDPEKSLAQGIGLAMGNLYAADVITFFAILGSLLCVSYYRRYREREVSETRLRLDAALLEKDLARARMEALTVQLRPHFLFNALNAISELMHRDVEEADRMVVRLGDLLRQVMEKTDRSEVAVREELALVRAYLEIERLRLGDRLEVDLEVDPDALDLPIPTLGVQPLVENAVRHGTDRTSGRGRIEVRVTRDDRELRVEVRDAGPGPGASAEGSGGGRGLDNIRRRLRQRYADEASLELMPAEGGGTRALLRIPVPSP